MSLILNSLGRQADELGRKLMEMLTKRTRRKLFFSTLARLLEKHFHFDRLCINLYDQKGEMLTYFTAAEGTIVSTLSPVRPAEASSTVAGHVIETRKPVVITDFAQYFPESSIHPIAEAGLASTMAFPLMLDNEIIATLHCSFAEPPANIYDITSFLVELSPVIATCLGAILSLEHLHYQTVQAPLQPLFFPTTEDTVVCHSPAMRAIMRKINTIAKLHLPVLLLGETGTGKSLIAQEIHRRSQCKEAHFVKVNCPSLAPTLFESELFGHAKGAFTGAETKRMGRFELAHGGTLFMDEIAELTPEMQSKLLQVLEDSSFERVGESIPLAVNVRIISATNVDVQKAVQEGKLRADLYYRLSGYTVELPPLRERKEDLAPLAALTAAQAANQLGLPAVNLTTALTAPLLQHRWPGNVRELRNVITKLVILASTQKKLTPADVQRTIEECSLHGPGAGSNTLENYRPRSLADVERDHIQQTLEYTRGIIAGAEGAAAILGMPRSTLQHRMQKLGIQFR